MATKTTKRPDPFRFSLDGLRPLAFFAPYPIVASDRFARRRRPEQRPEPPECGGPAETGAHA